MVERYISLTSLRGYLGTFLRASRAEAESALAKPVRDHEDAQALSEALLWQEAEEQTIAEIGQWASGNAVQGSLVLYTGAGPGLSGRE